MIVRGHVTCDDVVTRDNCHNQPALIKLTSIKFTHGPHHAKNAIYIVIMEYLFNLQFPSLFIEDM